MYIYVYDYNLIGSYITMNIIWTLLQIHVHFDWTWVISNILKFHTYSCTLLKANETRPPCSEEIWWYWLHQQIVSITVYTHMLYTNYIPLLLFIMFIGSKLQVFSSFNHHQKTEWFCQNKNRETCDHMYHLVI